MYKVKLDKHGVEFGASCGKCATFEEVYEPTKKEIIAIGSFSQTNTFLRRAEILKNLSWRIFVQVVAMSVLFVGMAYSCLASNTASANDADWYYNLIDGEAEIVGVWYYTDELIIPSTLDGHPVTRIGDYGMRGCKSLKSLVIPSSVRHIGTEALSSCSFSSVSIGSNVWRSPNFLQRYRTLARPRAVLTPFD